MRRMSQSGLESKVSLITMGPTWGLQSLLLNLQRGDDRLGLLEMPI